jgi:hypothetical protein
VAENIFELSDRNREEIASRIAKANGGDQDDGMEIAYDLAMDYLRISIGQSRQSLAFDLENGSGAIVLYDPESYLIVGLELPLFMAKVRSGVLHGEFWTIIADAVHEHGPNLYFAGKADSERAGRAFRELVPA